MINFHNIILVIYIAYILSHNKDTYFENLATTKNQSRETTTPKDVIDKEIDRDPPPKLYKSSCHTGPGGGNNNCYLQGNNKINVMLIIN